MWVKVRVRVKVTELARVRVRGWVLDSAKGSGRV
jgi:hypothetical protein